MRVNKHTIHVCGAAIHLALKASRERPISRPSFRKKENVWRVFQHKRATVCVLRRSGPSINRRRCCTGTGGGSVRSDTNAFPSSACTPPLLCVVLCNRVGISITERKYGNTATTTTTTTTTTTATWMHDRTKQASDTGSCSGGGVLNR